MQQDSVTDSSYNPGELTPFEQGQYTLLLHEDMSELAEGTLYFRLPGQEDYLYEYEGDLEEALDDLPEIYDIEVEQGKDQAPTLTPEAAIVVEHLWNYFDQTGEQELAGEQEYDFCIEADQLLAVPKDYSGAIVAISRDGQVNSTFEPEQFRHLMERFAIAYEQMQATEYQQGSDWDWER